MMPFAAMRLRNAAWPTTYGPLVQYFGPTWYAKLADNAANNTVVATVGSNATLLGPVNGSTSRPSKNTSLVTASSLLTSGADAAFALAGSSVVQSPAVTLSGTIGWTIVVLAKPTAQPGAGNSNVSSIFQLGDATGGGTGVVELDVLHNAGSTFFLRLVRSGSAVIGTTTTTWTYGTKLFIALRHLAGGNVELWVNGVKELDIAAPGFTYAATAPWWGAARFGGATITFYQLIGTLDEPSIFAFPLSDPQLAALLAAA